MCSMSRGMSVMLPKLITILFGNSDNVENMFGNMPKKILQMVTSTVSSCPIDNKNDQSIADAFKFNIYLP